MRDNLDIQYRKAIYSLLYTFKERTPAGRFSALLEDLQEKLEHVPVNDLEQSRTFFKEMTHSLLSKLNEHMTIVHTEVEKANVLEDKFEFLINEELAKKVNDFSKYADTPRFMDGFLASRNNILYHQIRQYGKSELRGLDNFKENPEANSYEISINSIHRDDPLKLPKVGNIHIGTRYRSDYITLLERSVHNEKIRLDQINQQYDTLVSLVEEFNERVQAAIKKETIQFAIQNIRQVLANIMIPVSLIEDENLRKLCEENERKIFVKKATLDDLLPIGTSVHVYSSHDLDDDSSYIAKPILLTEELPHDTEELKYHGIGQYTGYDNKSARSLGGSNPYVINGNIYVKVDPADFEALVPKELQEDALICEEFMKNNYIVVNYSENNDLEIKKNTNNYKVILRSKNKNTIVSSIENNDDVITCSENEYKIADLGHAEKLQKTINLVHSEKYESIQEYIESFTKVASLIANKEKDAAEGSTEASKELFKEQDLLVNSELFTYHPLHPQGYTIIYSGFGEYMFVKKRAGTEKVLVYTSRDLRECCKAGELSDGIYSVYHYARRAQTKREALHKLFPYKA